MNIQNIFVAIIILAAFLYVGNILRQKIKSFKPKAGSCGSDCGCESKSKVKI